MSEMDKLGKLIKDLDIKTERRFRSRRYAACSLTALSSGRIPCLSITDCSTS